MHVELLDRNMVDSDIGVVNAARCSFEKESCYEWYCTEGNSLNEKRLKQEDAKLIRYLAKNKHWTPFAHAQEVFELKLRDDELVHFFLQANLAGFEWCKDKVLVHDTLHTSVHCPNNCENPEHYERLLDIRGSLYAWLTNYQHLPQDIAQNLNGYLSLKYPISSNAITPEFRDFGGSNRIVNVPFINTHLSDELVPYTLRLTVPIFVKRQLETHRRNFVLTDIEDFSQNEVSRRYVDSEPEVYTPDYWSYQHKKKKQGADKRLEEHSAEAILTSSNYNHHMANSLNFYRNANKRGIAHEETRLFLPLSTYTTFWWTGSLKSWQRMFTLRLDTHAQRWTREVAQMCYEAIASSAPGTTLTREK
jgi:thymidylate synthase (FAD)